MAKLPIAILVGAGTILLPFMGYKAPFIKQSK